MVRLIDRSPTRQVVIFCAAVSYLILHMFHVPLFSLCCLAYRCFIKFLARLFRKDLAEFLPGVSNLFAMTDVTKNPKVNLHIGIVLDGEISVESYRAQFEERITNKRKPNGDYMYPEMRQSWTSFLGYYWWCWDPDFDIRNHIRKYDYGEELHIPIPCEEEDLRRTMGGLLAHQWDKKRSPWEVLIVPGYQIPSSKKPGTAVIVRAHHVMGDGITLSRIFLMEFGGGATAAPTPALSRMQGDSKATPVVKLGRALVFPWQVAHAAAETLVDSFSWSNPWHFVFAKLSREFHTAFTQPIAVSRIKKIKNNFNASYAAVLCTAAAGAIRKVMQSAGQNVPESIVCLSPIPFPNHPGGFVNHALPLKIEDKQKCMLIVDEYLKKAKTPAYMQAQMILMSYLGITPIIHNRFFKTMISATVGLSIFAVPENPPKILGTNIVDIMSGFGLGTGRAGAFGLIVSLNGMQRFVFNIDKNVFPDESLFKSMGTYIEEEIDAMLEASKVVKP